VNTRARGTGSGSRRKTGISRTVLIRIGDLRSLFSDGEVVGRPPAIVGVAQVAMHKTEGKQYPNISYNNHRHGF
jgi:hypothetical protein